MDQSRKSNAFIGRPLERIEDLRLLRGRGQYVGDLAPEGALHAVVLRSSVAHGLIRRIDAGGARAQPGIAHGKVRYVGEPLALVVAESAAIAEDALDHIDVDIEPLAAVADRDTARSGRSILFDTTGTNLAITVTAIRGDADAAFNNAPYTRCERFTVQRHAAVPMEPRGLVAE